MEHKVFEKLQSQEHKKWERKSYANACKLIVKVIHNHKKSIDGLPALFFLFIHLTLSMVCTALLRRKRTIDEGRK
jgi:hypothetical protein